MITNHILEDKWRVQKELIQQAGYDPARYIALAHEGALEMQDRYGIKLRYVDREVSLSAESQLQEREKLPGVDVLP